MKAASFIPILLIALVITLLAEERKNQSAPLHAAAAHAILVPDQFKWQDGPPGLPPGAKFVVLEGDPGKEGPFTMRALLPDGYRVPPHTHPGLEHVTVLRGTLNFGMGEKFDEGATKSMPAGAFGYWPAGMTHFVSVKGETEIQVHGVGPWGITYVNPADDPRKTRETVSQ